MTALKDVITDKQLNRLSAANREIVFKDYEYVSTLEPFSIKYVKKSVHFSDPSDIVTDKTCDLSFLEGATIKKIGFHKKAQEGGLAVVYEKNGEEKVVVLGFTELGMWIYANVKTNQ